MWLKIQVALITGFMLVATPSFANLTTDVYEDVARLQALGTPSGQYNAGLSMLRIMNNYTAAIKWFRLSAMQGHATAQAVLGSMYAVGLGIDKDFALADAWVRMAIPKLEGKMLDRASALQAELVMLMTPEQSADSNKIFLALKGLISQ